MVAFLKKSLDIWETTRLYLVKARVEIFISLTQVLADLEWVLRLRALLATRE